MASHGHPWLKALKPVTCWQMHGLGVFQGVVLACSKNGLFMGQIRHQRGRFFGFTSS